MNQFMPVVRTLVLLLSVSFFDFAQADNAEEALVKSCSGFISSKDIPEDSVCYEYISGFIDGAVLTDSAIIENISKEQKELSDFFNRAYKTRVGNDRKKVPATYYANFCLPEDQSRKMVIEELIHQLDAEVITKQTFKLTLYETLKRVYQCEEEAYME